MRSSREKREPKMRSSRKGAPLFCRYDDCTNATPGNVCDHPDECNCAITCPKCREYLGLAPDPKDEPSLLSGKFGKARSIREVIGRLEGIEHEMFNRPCLKVKEGRLRCLETLPVHKLNPYLMCSECAAYTHLGRAIRALREGLN